MKKKAGNKKPKTARLSGRLSVDGMLDRGSLGLNRSYQPGMTQPRPSIDEVADNEDGFHAQRPAAALDSLYKPLDDPEAELLSDKADKSVAVGAAGTPSKVESAKRRRFWRRSSQETKKPKDDSQQPVSRRRRILRRLGRVLLVLIVLAGLFFGWRLYQTSRNVFRGGGASAGLDYCRNLSQLKTEGDCRINVLLLGIGGPGHDGPDLTDTIMLASIDPLNNTAVLLSIPRDLWVQIPGYGEQKINSAYPDGKDNSTAKSTDGKIRDGLKLLDQTLEPVIGVPINYHVLVDFSAFKQAVNAVGGVTINVIPDELNYPYNSSSHTELYDPTIAWENNNNPVIAKEGLQTMNGQQALLFARSRETSSDFARSARQRALLVAIQQKVLSLGTFSNPVRINQLLSSLGNNVFTDFSLSDTKQAYNIGSKIPSHDIVSMDLATAPGNLVTTGSADGLSIVEPVVGLFDYSQIKPFVEGTLRDGGLESENAAVAVYNATGTTGLAASQATTLRSVGYRVTTVATAPKSLDPAHTIVVDLSSGADKYTLHYLQLRYGATAVTSLPAGYGITPPAGTDFVIILGQNATSSQSTP